MYNQSIEEFCEKTGWVDKRHLEYWMAIREVINPSGEREVGVYLCSGADALTFFLVTDVKVAYFVDGLRFGFEHQLDDARFNSEVDEAKYWLHTSLGGGLGGGFTWTSVLAATKLLRVPLCWELEAMGAEGVVIEEIESNVHQIDFDWIHWGKGDVRHRRILFFGQVDARNPGQYPEMLKDLLKEGVDVYLEKAACDPFARYNAPLDGGSRWYEFCSFTKLNPDSILVTTRYPEAGIGGFKEIKSNDLHRLEESGAKFGVYTAILFKKV